MSEENNKDKVFVYGTLKRGYGNHHWMNNSHFISEYQTPPEFEMVSLGGFPGVLLDGKNSITGEIFELERGIESLDPLEGYPHFYNRKRISTPYGEVWIYFLPERYGGYDKVESGVW